MQTNKKTRLGRGLASIFNAKKEEQYLQKNVIQYINIDWIQTNPVQPRTKIAKKELHELSDSIKAYGVIQPITVRQINKTKYELISGERRLQASKLTGLKKIPVFIKNIDDNQMLEVALVENIQRENLDPIEIALSLKQLIQNYNIKQETLGKKLGKSRSTISNYLRLLRLDPIIQAGIRDKIITMGHAKAILNIIDKNIQLDIYRSIITHKYSVRETEFVVKNHTTPTHQETKYKNQVLSIYFQKIEKELSEFLNQNVKLKISKNGKGKIEIPFSSEKKLDDIIQILQS